MGIRGELIEGSLDLHLHGLRREVAGLHILVDLQQLVRDLPGMDLRDNQAVVSGQGWAGTEGSATAQSPNSLMEAQPCPAGESRGAWGCSRAEPLSSQSPSCDPAPPCPLARAPSATSVLAWTPPGMGTPNLPGQHS